MMWLLVAVMCFIIVQRANTYGRAALKEEKERKERVRKLYREEDESDS